MYTKQQTSIQKQAFWTAFGKYMQPIPSADGDKVNWINYKTGISGIHFRMDADHQQASIAIVLSEGDIDLQSRHYDLFVQLKHLLQTALGEDWRWQPLIQNEFGKTISTISKTITGVNINRTEDWPEIISFFKPRIIALDAFWSLSKYGFEGMC